jgi:hypothetical protein
VRPTLVKHQRYGREPRPTPAHDAPAQYTVTFHTVTFHTAANDIAITDTAANDTAANDTAVHGAAIGGTMTSRGTLRKHRGQCCGTIASDAIGSWQVPITLSSNRQWFHEA